MIEVTAVIKNGTLKPDQQVQYVNELSKLEGKTVLITVVPVEVRSSKQNNYYWGTLIYMIHQDLVSKGWRADDLDTLEYDGNLTKHQVHLYMRHKYLVADVFDPKTGNITGSTVRSTSDLTTKEFAEYIELVRLWAVEMLGLNIPDPNETV